MVECKSMQDVRREIDRLDREIVPLLLERVGYIKQAGHIKTERNQVRDNARVEEVVNNAKLAAQELNGDQSYIEDIYRHLMGFEPTKGLHPCRFSRPVHSTAL